MGKSLLDVVDESRDIREIFYPDKDKCSCVMLDNTFIPIKKDNKLIGCIGKCDNCGKLSEFSCTDPCGLCEIEDDDYGNSVSMSPCDLIKNRAFVEGLLILDYRTETWRTRGDVYRDYLEMEE